MKRNNGFTLIELLIVIAIVGILAGAMVPIFRVTQLTAQKAKVTAELDVIKTAAIMFHQDVGVWPVAGTQGTDFTVGIAPSGANWRGPYIDAWRADPWGTSYSVYTSGLQLWVESWGEVDRVNGGTDDIGMLITPSTAF